MTVPPIRVGSRGSALALAQASLVRDALELRGHRSAIVVLETEGDRRTPDTAWGEGAFVTAIERALLAGRIDVAVHSAKDVPTAEDARLRIAAYLPRADPRDALVVRQAAPYTSVAELPSRFRVGTDSPRRTGFLRAVRPDLVVHPLHGNVDTRLRRLDDHETDALVLACAGLDRLGLDSRIAERLAPDAVPPAPGQGAIAVQVRVDDAPLREVVAGFDDRATRLAVEAERAFLVASGGGCRAPIGALAEFVDGRLELLGGYVDPGGSWIVIERRDGPVDGGTTVARELARAMSSALPSHPGGRPALPGPEAPRVLVTRAATQVGGLVDALSSAGIDAVVVPTIEVEMASSDELEDAIRELHTVSWVVVTSANGARAVVGALPSPHAVPMPPRWAVIGSATARVLETAGITVDHQASRPTDETLGLELPVRDGERVLLVRGNLADDRLPAILRARRAVVDEVTAYRVREAPASSRGLLRSGLRGGPLSAVIFTSGSTVRGLVALAASEEVDVAGLGAVCVGPSTAKAARSAGFRVLAVANEPNAASLANATAAALSPRGDSLA